MSYDVIIVGAGASGLTAAIAAGRCGSKVLVLEHKDKAGKKILATGNGKCNYTNLYQSSECYRSDDSTFPLRVLSNFDMEKTISFFEQLGIHPKERGGYFYPNSEQAASVVQILMMECERLGVRFHYEENVEKITKPFFTVKTQKDTYFGIKLILATGGCASPNLGSDGSGFSLAESFGHTIIKPLPALVSLKSSEKFCKTISGVRMIAGVSAFCNNQLIAKEEGEIIFTDYGISGIPVMQISRFISKEIDKGNKVTLKLDFMTKLSKEELILYLKIRVQNSIGKNSEQMMIGLLNHKISYIILKNAGIDLSKAAVKLSDKEIEAILEQIKAFKMSISAPNTFEQAQVCTGGVRTDELDVDTLESKLVKNLYIVGETVDVDGTCGGYNLQWAWSSGYLAGYSAGNNK